MPCSVEELSCFPVDGSIFFYQWHFTFFAIPELLFSFILDAIIYYRFAKYSHTGGLYPGGSLTWQLCMSMFEVDWVFY